MYYIILDSDIVVGKRNNAYLFPSKEAAITYAESMGIYDQSSIIGTMVYEKE